MGWEYDMMVWYENFNKSRYQNLDSLWKQYNLLFTNVFDGVALLYYNHLHSLHPLRTITIILLILGTFSMHPYTLEKDDRYLTPLVSKAYGFFDCKYQLTIMSDIHATVSYYNKIKH